MKAEPKIPIIWAMICCIEALRLILRCIKYITADILVRMAKDASCHLENGGHLILSGIIDKYERKVINCFSQYGFCVTDKASDGCWRALTMVLNNGN